MFYNAWHQRLKPEKDPGEHSLETKVQQYTPLVYPHGLFVFQKDVLKVFATLFICYAVFWFSKKFPLKWEVK